MGIVCFFSVFDKFQVLSGDMIVIKFSFDDTVQTRQNKS